MHKNNTYRRRLLLLALCLSSVAMSVADDTLHVRYWGGIPGRVDYELEVLRAALSAGGDKPFEIVLISESLGSLRGRQEVVRAEVVNAYASGYRVDDLLESGQLLAIKQPLLQGLLGYRLLIARAAELARFEQVTELAYLRRFILGQGTAWYDNDIYRYNGIEVNDNGRFPLLPGMLAHGRFDALALGIMEAEPVLRSSEYGSQLAIVPDLLLYYPHPLVFHVSAKAPELAYRLGRGMQIIRDNGTLDALFQQYFGEIIARLQSGSARLIVLDHPHKNATLGLSAPAFVPVQSPNPAGADASASH